MPQNRLTDEEFKKKWGDITLDAEVEEAAQEVVSDPALENASPTLQRNLIKKKFKQAALSAAFPPSAIFFNTKEDEEGVFDSSLTERLPERAVNAAQGAHFGSLFGLPGTVTGGALGFRQQPTGTELSSDLPAFLAEMGMNRLGGVPGAVGKFGRSALAEAGVVGGAVQLVGGNEDQTLIQVGGNLIGSGLGKVFRTFASSGKTIDPSSRSSSSVPVEDINPGLEKVRQLTPDEAIKFYRDAGFEVPTTALQEFGKPRSNQQFVDLILGTGGGERVLKEFGKKQDNALTKIAEGTFGESPRLVGPNRVVETMSNLGARKARDTVSLTFGDETIATLSKRQFGLFRNIFGGGSFDDIGKRLIRAEAGGTEGLEAIEIARRVAKKVDPEFDATLKRQMFEHLWGKSQKALVKESAGAVDVTQGSEFFKLISKMDPRKLEAAFDKDGAEALMTLGKVADAIDPSTMFRGTDLAEGRFVITKMGFMAASLTATTVVGTELAGSVNSGQDASLPGIALSGILGGLAGFGMFIGVGNLASRAVTSQRTAKLINQIADSDVGSNKWATGVRALIGDALANGDTAIDEETGTLFLYPFSENTTEKEQSPRPPHLEEFIRQRFPRSN